MLESLEEGKEKYVWLKWISLNSEQLYTPERKVERIFRFAYLHIQIAIKTLNRFSFTNSDNEDSNTTIFAKRSGKFSTMSICHEGCSKDAFDTGYVIQENRWRQNINHAVLRDRQVYKS